MVVKGILDRYLRIHADDALVVQRGQRLIILMLILGVADLLVISHDIVTRTATLSVLTAEVLGLVTFGVLYWYTRRGHLWPPYGFLAILALSAPYVVRGNLVSPVALVVALPVAVVPLISVPWLSILLAAVEIVILYIFGLASYPLYPVVAIVLGLLGGVSWLSSSSLENAFKEAHRNAIDLTATNRELEASRDALEAQTDVLTRRARYLEATARVARDAASVLTLQDLLTGVATLVSERFGFYHVGIFLLDPSGDWAELRAASSGGGQRMLAGGYRLHVGDASIVGYVADQGEPRIALDVGEDAVVFDNPDLPDTRSEMALPLQARGEIIGALDVQSSEPQAFSEEDVVVLQTLADQVAVAISNARLFQQVEESFEAERRAYGEISREAWRELLQAHQRLGYRYGKSGVTLLGEAPSPLRPDTLDKPASQSKRGANDSEGSSVPLASAVASADDSTAPQGADAKLVEELPELALPVIVRGHVIGTIQAHKPGEAGEWTAEEVALMETLAEQLGLALESARLYQDTQRRAFRERLTGEIAARMREKLDMDTVLQTAVREIGERLGIAEVEVRMGSEVATKGQGT
jgi:GAF domain-containing protein